MENSGRELLTAAEVARCCQVDMKTIHNWAGRGDLPHFRTPGRHLRFHRRDVLDFLRRYGYPIPTWLAGVPRVMVHGSAALTEALGAALGPEVSVSVCTDPQLFLLSMGATPPDAALLMADEVKEGPIFAAAATALLSASVTWSGVVRFGLGLHWLRAAMVSLLLLAILGVTCISLAVAYQANIVILAGLSLPFILITAYKALSGAYPGHRKLARRVWPVWFYVSVSGVVVYLLISPYY